MAIAHATNSGNAGPDANYPVVVDFVTESGAANILGLRVQCESRVTTGPRPVRFGLYNWTTQSWVYFNQQAETTDTMQEINTLNNHSQFVNPTTLEVKFRVMYKGIEGESPWNANIDQVRFHITRQQ